MTNGDKGFLDQMKQMWEIRRPFYLFAFNCEVTFAHRLKSMYIDTTYCEKGERTIFKHIKDFYPKKGGFV